MGEGGANGSAKAVGVGGVVIFTSLPSPFHSLR